MTGLTIPFTGLKRQCESLRDKITATTGEVLSSGVLMNGPHTERFERWLAHKNHSRYAITVGSGTAALECLAEYYRKDYSKESRPVILVPGMTYVATANAFTRAGWDLHFIDVDCYGIFNPDSIDDRINYQAVVLVGLYGASLSPQQHTRAWLDWSLTDTTVIEDAAQHWLASDSFRIGSASAISFDPMKNLPCYGNGGAIVTDDINVRNFALQWRDAGKPLHYITGTNSRMSELDCALMMLKVEHLAEWQDRRTNIANYWIEQCRDSENIRTLINDSNKHDHSFHKFVIEVDYRVQLQQLLKEQSNIETKMHYALPLFELDVMHQWPNPGLLSVSSTLCRRVLSLPIYPELTDSEVEYVIAQTLIHASSVRN